MIVFQDAHCEPEGLTPQLRQLLRETGDEPLASNGDLANFLPHGLDRYRGSGFLKELKRELRGRSLWVIGGNHDPLPWCKELYQGIPRIHPCRSITHNHFERGPSILLRHGHGWAPDWWLLRHVAPGFVDFMTDHLPKPWYWFSKKMGWMPSQVEGEEEYHLVVLSVWANALRYAQARYPMRVICGHTHKLGAVVGLFAHGLDYVMVDAGTLATGSFLRITNDGEIIFESLEEQHEANDIEKQAEEERDHIIKQANEECERIVKPARENYERIRTQAQEECDRIVTQAWEEYIRIVEGL